MMKHLIALALAGAFICPFTSSAQQTRRLTAEKHNEYGVIYALPITNIAVTVKARKTVSEPGPFHQYAKQCLGASEVITQAATEWEILDVTMSTFGMADRNEEYLMQLKPGAVTFLNVASDGMLLSINTDSEEERKEPASVIISTEGDTKYNPDGYLQYASEDFLASQSSFKQAQMLTESIMEVRDAKLSLTRGTADNMPSDGQQMDLMLKSLSHQEEMLTKAFTGNSWSQTMEATYTFLPTEEGRSVLLRINDFDGFTDADDYSGEPMYITISNVVNASIPVDDKDEEKKLPKDAVMYTIPGSAQASLTWRGKQILSAQLDLAQFGVQFGLNPTLFTDRKAPSYLILDPATGAIKSIGAVSNLEQ